eukprot:12078930-Karenia_brevis.AAC.1
MLASMAPVPSPPSCLGSWLPSAVRITNVRQLGCVLCTAESYELNALASFFVMRPLPSLPS